MYVIPGNNATTLPIVFPYPLDPHHSTPTNLTTRTPTPTHIPPLSSPRHPYKPYANPHLERTKT